MSRRGRKARFVKRGNDERKLERDRAQDKELDGIDIQEQYVKMVPCVLGRRISKNHFWEKEVRSGKAGRLEAWK